MSVKARAEPLIKEGSPPHCEAGTWSSKWRIRWSKLKKLKKGKEELNANRKIYVQGRPKLGSSVTLIVGCRGVRQLVIPVIRLVVPLGFKAW